ncbi:MAG TPA: effector binding domain-containing protein [Mucilaginibacter sp.]|jgi:predicted transcriptional regulator YdeE|nr:effector binding domain-containing protein [Mucilaginibacter sp.]
MITKTETIELPAFNVAGITVRTINQNGQSKKDMMALWARFMANNMVQQIDNRVSDDIYCFYTDYESDHLGYYTALLGRKVKSPANAAVNFTLLTVPPQKYRVYSLDGEIPGNVLSAWQEIWDSDANRAYTVDFDLYTANAKSFEETEAKIYLAVR